MTDHSKPMPTECIKLSDALRDRGPLAERDVVQILIDVSGQAAAVHASRRIHGRISVESIITNDSGTNAELLVDSEQLLEAPCPLPLTCDCTDMIPPLMDHAAASQWLRDHGMELTPERLDVYQLGALLCRLSTNESVESYLQSPRIASRLPAALRSIVERALGVASGEPLGSVEDFLSALQELSGGEVPQGQPPDAPPRAATGPTEDTHSNLGAEQISDLAPTGKRPRAAAVMDPVGGRLGHFTIESRIGRGGMGDVYRGYDATLKRTVAIKVLPADLAQADEFVRRFYAEASGAARVSHPNVIAIYFIGEDQGRHFFAMQYVSGESLADRLARRGRLSVEESLALMEQALAGLAAAHARQLIHRDIKPGNILLEGDRALLADFGLVKFLQEEGSEKTATGVVLGTVDYMAPEQGRGQPVDHRSDLYSMGVLLFRMLSGQLPFDADSATAKIFQHVYEPPPPLESVAPEAPRGLSAVVSKLLAKSPAQRYDSAEQVLADLRAVRNNLPLPSRADEALAADGGIFARPVRESEGRGGTVIIEAPRFGSEPSLPESLSQISPPQGWWSGVQRRWREWFWTYAPEAVQRLQNTQHQVDGAVAEYERRQRQLALLVQQGDEALHELRSQESQWREAAREAAGKLHAAESEPSRISARSAQAHAEQVAEELGQAAAQQREQLDTMRLRLDKVNARLHQLTAQRDLLNARLRIAQAQLGKPAFRWKQVLTAPLNSGPRSLIAARIALVGTALVAATLVTLKLREPETVNIADSKQEVEPAPEETVAVVQQKPLMTQVLAEPKASMELEGAVAMASLADDGSFVSLSSDPKSMRLWSIDSDQAQLRELRENTVVRAIGGDAFRFVSSDAVSPDADLVVEDVRNQSLTALDVLPGEEIVHCVVTPDGNHLLAVVKNDVAESLQTWDLSSGARQRSIPVGNGCLQAIPGDDGVICLNSAGQVIRYTQTEVEGVSSTVLKKSGATCLAFDPDSETLAIGMSNGEVELWPVDGDAAASTLSGGSHSVLTMQFGPQGRLAVSDGELVRIWDRRLRYVRIVLEAEDVSVLDFDKLGDSLMTAGQSRVDVWSTEFAMINVDFAEVPVSGIGYDAFDPTIAYSSDNRLRVSAPRDQLVRLEDARDGEFIHKIGEDVHALSVAISPNDEFVATGGGLVNSYEGDGTGDLKLFRLRTGEEIRRFIGHRHYVWYIRFSRDGSRMLSGGTGTVHLWDVATGEELQMFLLNAGAGRPFAKHLEFSPDETQVVANTGGSNYFESYLLDVETGEQIAKFRHGNPRVIFSRPEVLCDTRFGVYRNAVTPEINEGLVTQPTTETQPLDPALLTGTREWQRAQERSAGCLGAWRQRQDHGSSSAQFKNQLRSIAPILHEVPVAVDDEPLKWEFWRPIDTGNREVKFSAFRFRSPLDVPADMYWVFSMPDSEGNWQLVDGNGNPDQAGAPSGISPGEDRPQEGLVQFSTFDTRRGVAVEGVTFPPGNLTFLQPLHGGLIEPGKDYIVWFHFPAVPPDEIPLAIRLVRSEESTYAFSADEIAAELGIQLDYQRFEPTSEGVADAFYACRKLFHDGFTGRQLLEALWSVEPALPEVQLSDEARTHWNTVVPTESFTFNAVRFRSPHSQAAHLCVGLAAEDDKFRWGVTSRGELREKGGDAWHMMNLSIDGASLPDQNEALFEAASIADILPDEEYILWFVGRQSTLPDMQLAVRLIPEDEFESPETLQQAANIVGVDLPDIPTDAQVRAVLDYCRQSFADQTTDSVAFHRYLDWVKPALPAITLTETEVHWNTLRLVGNSSGFYAFRLPASDLRGRPLAFAIAKPALPRTAWSVSATDTALNVKGERFGQEDYTLDALPDLPDENMLIAEWLGSSLPSQDEYVLWFAPENADDEMTLYLAARYSTERPREEPGSFRAVAHQIGLDLPTAETLPGSVTLEGHEDAVLAVSLAPDGETWVSGAADGTLCEWSSRGELLRTIPATRGGIAEMEFSPDGRTLATSHVDSTVVQLWAYPELTETQVLRANGELRKLAFSPDSSLLAGCAIPSSQSPDNISSARIWSLPEGDVLYDLPAGEYWITDAVFADDGGSALFCGHYQKGFGDQAGRFLVDLDELTMQSEGRYRGAGWRDCDLTSNDEWVAAQSYGAVGKGSGNGGPVRIAANYALVLAQAVSSDGALLALAVHDGRIQLWDIPRLRLLHQWQAHEPTVNDVAFSADGASLASAGDDGVLRIWDLDYQLRQTLDRSQLDPIVDSIGITLQPIPAGTFRMGTHESATPPEGFAATGDFSAEQPQHPVRLTRPFYIAAHETTVGQFRSFIEATGYETTAEREGLGQHYSDERHDYEFRPEWNWKNPGFEQSDEHPVVQVSYDDALRFCAWLSESEGATYRLPTEAEWEYACRGGSSTPWCFGSADEPWMLPVTANVADETLRRRHDGVFAFAASWDDGYPFTSPVGTFAANAYGLFDMHGNAFEWCSDFYDPVYYRNSPEIDPLGPAEGENHVQRGACWFLSPTDSRSTRRDQGPGNQTQSWLGFRVVREFETAPIDAD